MLDKLGPSDFNEESNLGSYQFPIFVFACYAFANCLYNLGSNKATSGSSFSLSVLFKKHPYFKNNSYLYH